MTAPVRERRPHPALAAPPALRRTPPSLWLPGDHHGFIVPNGVGARRSVLALQRLAGNAATATLLAGPSRVVQRDLIPLNAQDRPGRLRDNETTLKDLLAANGLTLVDRQKARSDDGHDADLVARMQRVLAVEAKFSGSNINPAKRRMLRSELANEYDELVDTAERYRDDADAAYDAALTAEAQRIRTGNPTVNELFKNQGPWQAAEPGVVLAARIAKFQGREKYLDNVRSRYKALYKTGMAAPSPLSGPDQAALQAEKVAVEAQLTAWANKQWNAPGCNANGTWGTSAGGAGAGFAATHLKPSVWAELKTWWRGKQNTYVMASDTTTYSLKKFRVLGQGDDRSRTFNYHIWVP